MSYMERALSLSRRALGLSSPNPAVGAVVVNNGEIVGEGWTQPPGQAHAEVMALQQSGDRAAGAAMYVTLEPCSHYGKTPPCTQAIISAGVAEVHIATVDPNPAVNGSGIAQLQQAGIRTSIGERQDEARKVIEAFAHFITTGVPFSTVKFAVSLDGKIATRTGDSRWITGPEARAYVHQLRAGADAILTGVNTVLADDPQLTARDRDGRPLERQPLRVVVDGSGRTPQKARLLAEPGETLIAVSRADESARRRLAQAGAQVEVMPADDGSVDLDGLFRLLAQRQVTSVLVEAGGALVGSLFDRGLVDKVIAFVAPVIIGGRDAPSPVAGAGAQRMAEVMRLHRVETMQFGNDTAIIGYREAREECSQG